MQLMKALTWSGRAASKSLVPLMSAALLSSASGACGSKTQLLGGGPREDAGFPDCERTEDCDGAGDLCKPVSCIDGKCVNERPIVCNDGDPCTDDSCDPRLGTCSFTPSSFDLDGDGHRGPKPGTIAGAQGSCGDDCDDTRKNAFPGNKEICDGVDNDCNGVIDDGARYVPKAGSADGIRVSTNLLSRSSPGGIAHDGTRYFANYTGTLKSKERVFGSFLDIDGTRLSSEDRLVQVESDAYSSGVVWTGDRFGSVWTDRRFDNYEVFFAMFDAAGKKMAPGDVRISISDQFSVNASLVWTGKEFVIVWQEGGGDNGSFSIFARRVGLDGQPIGNPVQLESAGESPAIAVGRPGLGLVWATGRDATSTTFFQPFDFNLTSLGPATQLSTKGGGPGEFPSVYWNDPTFVVLWRNPVAPFKIVGTTLNGTGSIMVQPKTVSDSPANARFGSLIPLGDRLLLVYSDDRDANQGYELYSRTLDTKLAPVGTSTRITNHIGDSTSPIAILGPKGEVGVLFRDQRDGPAQTYFTHLVCEASSVPPPEPNPPPPN